MTPYVSDFVTPSKPQTSRVPQLDGIRGLAIALVLVWHCLAIPLLLSSSPVLRTFGKIGSQFWSGVDLFFVLSGFLIGGILIDAKTSDRYFSTFYIRRAFRILPIYVICCAAYPFFRSYWQPMPWYVYASFTENLWLRDHLSRVWLMHGWSLAIEEQFYLTLPALIWVLPRKYIWKFAAFGVLASLMFRCFMYLRFSAEWAPAAYMLLPARADSLLLGVLAAALVRIPGALLYLQTHSGRLVQMAVLSGLPVVLFSFEGVGPMSPVMCTIGYTVIAVCYGCLLLLSLTSEGFVKHLFLQPWLRWLGSISYGLYLLHLSLLIPAFHIVRRHGMVINEPADLLPIAITLVLSLGLAQISWMYFESPLVRIGHRYTYAVRPGLEMMPPADSAPAS